MFDLIIKNGKVIDGTGKDAYFADIGIIGDKISKIGILEEKEAKKVIDAKDKYVTPGFIDPHTHADMTVIKNPTMEYYLMQGITTVVGGNCGHGRAPASDEVYCGLMEFELFQAMEPSYFKMFELRLPKKEATKALKEKYNIEFDCNSFKEYVDMCNKLPMDCNIAPLAGYNAIRNSVMGMNSLRDATPEELSKLEALTEECMKAGAFGLSTGRDAAYVPGPFASDEETIRMLKIVKKYNGIFASHTYNVSKEGKPDRMGGYKEMLNQAKAAGVRANISHVHIMGMAATQEDGIKAAYDTINYFEQMEKEGMDISYDIIPSPYSIDLTIPYFSFFLQPFVLMSGTRAHLAENFKVQDFRQMVREVIKAGMYPSLDTTSPMCFLPLLGVEQHKNKAHIGKNIMAYASELGKDPLDLVMDLFAEDPDMGVNMATAAFPEANDILSRHRLAMPCSDGMTGTKDGNLSGMDEIPLYPNPMSISFIPRYILRHGKTRFEDTIRQISGYVAERFNINNRGILKEGNYADIVVLDKDNLYSYDMDANPLQYPEGFDQVIVNGVPTIEKKRHLGAAAGRMLTKI